MQTRQNILWTVVLAITSIFTGCIYDHDEPSSHLEGGNSLKIKFTLPAGEARTRSVPAEPGENNINDLTLLFFDYTTNGTGAFVTSHQVAREDIPAEEDLYGDLNNLFDLEVVFQNSLGLTISNAYSILVFANLGSGNYFNDIYDQSEFISFIGEISKMDQNAVRQYMVMTVTGVGGSIEEQENNSQRLPIDNLPMSATTTKEANSANVDCQLIRTVVRYDVINKTQNHTLVSASIWNAFPHGYVFDNQNVDYSYSHLKRYYGLRNAQGLEDIHGGLYSFENVNTNPAQKDDKTTCLILGLIDNNAPGDGPSYYRVNISPKVTGQYLTRNNVYQVTISAVNGRGAPSEPDAYDSEKVQLDTSINSWDRDEDGLIVRNETHMMAIPTKRTYFGPEATEGEYFIYTMGEGTLTMNTLAMPEGMTATLNGNTLYVRVTAFGGDKRTGAVRFNFAGLTAVMEIIQSGEASKTLKLSHTQVGSWPAGPQWINRMAENPVEVESSGPWTAEIYNANFSFANGSTQESLNGNNRDKIENVFNTTLNDNPAMRHSFILVTLDDDPENYRNVIVLTQLGIGGFSLEPANRQVTFNADGSPRSESPNTFTVLPGENDDIWTAEISGTDASSFEIAFEGTPENGKMKGTGKFTITSKVENFEDRPLAAILTVTHNDLNTQVINLNQESHIFRLSQTSLTIGPAGGETVLIRVECSKSDATWSAGITNNTPPSANMQPYIINSNGERVTSVSNQPLTNTFRVWMPPILTKLDQNPEAKVIVTLNSSGKEATLIVTQEPVIYAPIYAQTLLPAQLGSWVSRGSANYNLFGQWANEMINSSNFGPTGAVYTQSVINISRGKKFPDTDEYNPPTRIYNANDATGDSKMINFLIPRKQDPNCVFIIYSWTSGLKPFNLLGLGSDYTIRYGAPQANTSRPRKIYKDESVMGTELWKYIFEEGPFGMVNPDKVALHPQYYPDYMTYLTQWPETFIPLMQAINANGDPISGTALLGIDPTNRLIWIGHKDMFGIDSTAYPNWNNSDNITFLRNLIAWMVNVNNYGDAFNNRFKIP